MRTNPRNHTASETPQACRPGPGRSPRAQRPRPLGLAILCLGGLLLSSAVSADEERVELVAERTAFTKTFDNGDGSIAIQTGLEPLHYGDPGSGEMLDIDPALVAEDGWRNETNSIPVHLPVSLGDGSALSFGPELSISWRPGRLIARLINGVDIDLGDPSPAWGQPSEELPNAITYTELYPGLDLRVEVRRGTLNLEMVLREWLVGFEREQVDSLSVEGLLEIPAELLELAEERAQQGELLEELPLYLGRSGDEYVLSVLSDPGLSEPQLEEYASALRTDPEGQHPAAPVGWVSTLGEWLATGRVRHHFRYSLPIVGEEAGFGVAESALMASFKLRSEEEMRLHRLFSLSQPGVVGVTVTRKETSGGPRYPYRLNRIEAGRGDGKIHRAFVLFGGMKDLARQLQQFGAWEIQEVSLGTLNSHYLPPDGVVAIESDNIVAGSIVDHFENGGLDIRLKASDTILDQPYNLTSRAIPGGSLSTGTWDYLAGAGFTTRILGGDAFFFGPLANKAPGVSSTRAALDVTRTLDKGYERFGLGLALPQEQVLCTACTNAHQDPAVQALNGEYRVGAGYYDLRLEVRAAGTVPHQVTVSVVSVGGHNDQLYPGESLEWELELSSKSSGAGDLELTAQGWDPRDGVSFSFHDPANPGTGLPAGVLNAVGDKVRVRATWHRARPDLYGQTRDLRLDGLLSPSGRLVSGQVRIPITLKAPEGLPTFSPIYPIFDDNVSAPMGLAWIQLPAQTRGAALGDGKVRYRSGPTAQLRQGVHWDRWSSASPGNPGELVIYPDQFRPGQYTVDLDPCLLPDGMPAPLHCGSAQSLGFEIRAASTPATPTPVIDFVSPWSIDDPSGGPRTISIFGSDLGGSAGTSVSIPQVVSGAAPAAGSSATRVDISTSLSGGSTCGPRELALTTPGGTATATFNVTKPFAGNPHHFVSEAEGAVLGGLQVQTMSGASGGRVVAIASDGAPGSLKLRFRVPVTSSSYQLYAVYGTPEPNAVRADLTVREGSTTVDYFKIALPQVSAGQRSLRPLYDATQSAPPSLLTLEAGKTYELEIASRAGQRYPLLDLLILSDGALPPTFAELCL